MGRKGNGALVWPAAAPLLMAERAVGRLGRELEGERLGRGHEGRQVERRHACRAEVTGKVPGECQEVTKKPEGTGKVPGSYKELTRKWRQWSTQEIRLRRVHEGEST